MLQRAPHQFSNRSTEVVPAFDATNLVSIESVAPFLKRHFWTIVTPITISLLIGLAYILVTPPAYVASAQIMIEPQKAQMFWQEPGTLDFTLDNAQVESQLEVLRGERISLAVIRELNLIQDPEFGGDGQGSEHERRRVALSAFTARINVRRIGQSYLIEVGFRAATPSKAAIIVNAIAGAYIRDQLEAKSSAARTGIEWLQARIAELGPQLNAASREVLEFKTRNGIVDTGARGLLIDQQISEMNTQLVLARSRTAETQARVFRIDEALAKGAAGAAVTEVLNNPVIANLRQRYLDAAKRESELSARYGMGHDSVVNLRREIQEYDRAMTAELRRIGETFQSEFQVAKSREDNVASEIKKLILDADKRKQAEVTLAELEARTHAYRRLYESFVQKLTETTQKESFPVSSARVITWGTEPLNKSYPRSKLIMALAMLVGALCGIGAALLRHRFDHTLRSPTQFANIDRMKCVGTLPALDQRVADPAMLTNVTASPFSEFADAMRLVKVSIDNASLVKPISSIGVLSVLPGEGKTTVATNLAALFSASGLSTLLIDANFRNSTVSQTFAPEARSGLVEQLKGLTLNAVTRNERIEADILPIAAGKRIANSSDLLGSRNMQTAIEQFRATHQIVIVDLPALTAGADARAILPLLDATLIVAEWGRAPLASLAEMPDTIDAAQAQLLGVVINKSAGTTIAVPSFLRNMFERLQSLLAQARTVRRPALRELWHLRAIIARR